MKQRMFFGKVRIALLCVVLAIGLAVMVLDILMLSKVIEIYNDSISGVSLAAAVLLIVWTLLVLFNSYYKFNDDHLKIVTGIFADKIFYSNVTEIFVSVETGELFIKHGDKKFSSSTLRFNLKKEDSRAVLYKLIKTCPTVPVNYFEPPAKKGKEEDK